ncbi:hypothetical protein [Phenylobacterium sp.]|jgi:hypothetical protein|uniref:hypothetical protein n=1 Tax=Phenylobacterium sp. TaxID=1871053 RepID=UPI002E31861D|nr:hypothetical protein [Phenylobacterium sp.]HEX4712634.1 hypothetical protein [Phenylobacterium sp.]
MRTLAIATAALASSATAAFAAPASVSVTIGPELQEKAARTLGVREVNDLANDLRTTVEKQLARTAAYDGARIELELTDAQPNRPTFKQLGDTPGLSYESFGLGGARIEGSAIAPDGHVTPLSYKYYESDIRWARRGGTWADAQWTFDRFAHKLGRGDAVASR